MDECASETAHVDSKLVALPASRHPLLFPGHGREEGPQPYPPHPRARISLASMADPAGAGLAARDMEMDSDSDESSDGGGPEVPRRRDYAQTLHKIVSRRARAIVGPALHRR